MYESEGAGLAAPQIGVQKRLFVYDVVRGPGPGQPVHRRAGRGVVLRRGLPVDPGPPAGDRASRSVHITGYGLDGEERSLEADVFLGRVFQHEVDHLDGVLMLERLDEDMRRQALRVLRDRSLGLDTTAMEAKLVRPTATGPSDHFRARRRRPWPGWSFSGHPRRQWPRCARWWPPGTTWRWW